MKSVLDKDIRSISVKEVAWKMAPAAAILMLPPALLAMYFAATVLFGGDFLGAMETLLAVFVLSLMSWWIFLAYFFAILLSVVILPGFLVRKIYLWCKSRITRAVETAPTKSAGPESDTEPR